MQDNIIPKLRSDIPSEHWLNSKKSLANEYGVDPTTGVPRSFGVITGYFEGNTPIKIPVDVLKVIKGQKGEQNSVRKDDLAWLVNYMKEGYLPIMNGKEYYPYIEVDQNGNPWINEGNHRIMAADQLDWEWMSVEIRYFNGGETIDNGLLSPDKIKAWQEEYLASLESDCVMR